MSRLYEELVKSHEDTLTEAEIKINKPVENSLADKMLKKLQAANESLTEDNQKVSLYDKIMQKLNVTEDLNTEEPVSNGVGAQAKNALNSILSTAGISIEPIIDNSIAIFKGKDAITVVFYDDNKIEVIEDEKIKKVNSISDLITLINKYLNTNLTYNDYKSLSDLYGEGNMEEKLMEEYDNNRNNEAISTYRYYAGLKDDDIIESLDEKALVKASCYHNYDINDLRELLLKK